MDKMLYKFAKTLKGDITYIFLNSIVGKFPFWPVRRFFYILAGIKIGKGSRILRNTVIVGAKNISIGHRTYINENCFLDGRSGIEIGNDVTIAIYSKLISGGHYINDEDFAYHGEKIRIGNNVALFANSIVLGGAIINNGCVFSAMSLVRKGVYAEKGVFAGNPAKYIQERKCELKYKQDYWHPIFR